VTLYSSQICLWWCYQYFMLIRLDKHTCAEFLAQWVTDVSVDIITAGCAGSKILVSPKTDTDDRIGFDSYHGMRCWVLPEHVSKLDGAQIARAKGKYYLVSENIQSRCWCGTSFSFEKKAISNNLAKIHRLQNALKMSPEVQKMQKILENTPKK